MSIAKLLIVVGLILVAAGLLVALAERVPWLGRLPGDIFIRGERFTFYFPLATSILLSLLLSAVLYFFRK